MIGISEKEREREKDWDKRGKVVRERLKCKQRKQAGERRNESEMERSEEISQ